MDGACCPVIPFKSSMASRSRQSFHGTERRSKDQEVLGKEGLAFSLENYESQYPGEWLAKCTTDNMASDAFAKLEFFQGERRRKDQSTVCLPMNTTLTPEVQTTPTPSCLHPPASCPGDGGYCLSPLDLQLTMMASPLRH